METLLESISLPTESRVFDLEGPRLVSGFGKLHLSGSNVNNAPPAPMVLTPDSGLVLYERVITLKQEHQLLAKLSKPKYINSTHEQTASTSGRHGHSHDDAAHSARRRPRTGHAHHNSPAVAATGAATSARRPSPSAPPGDMLPRASTTPGLAGAAAQHPTRSSLGGSGTGAPPCEGRAPRRAVKELIQQIDPYAVDSVNLKRYFDQERAAVTVRSVFTWGNRYRPGGEPSRKSRETRAIVHDGSNPHGRPLESGTFTSWSPSQHKPPLRL